MTDNFLTSTILGIRRSASALTSDPTRSVKRRENTENNMSSSDSPSTPSFLLTPSTPSLRSDSLTSSSLSTPVTKTFLHDRSSESPSSGKELETRFSEIERLSQKQTNTGGPVVFVVCHCQLYYLVLDQPYLQPYLRPVN